MKKILQIITTVGAFALASTNVQAAPVLTFDNSADLGNIGSLSYAGGTSTLVGTDIMFDQITGSDTAANSGVILRSTSGFYLNFETGNYVGNILSLDIWGDGGFASITTTGDIYADLDSSGDFTVGDNLLYNGDGTTEFMLVDGAFDTVTVDNDGSLSGNGFDVKSSLLTDFYQTPPNFTFSSTQIRSDRTGPGGSQSLWTATVIEADFVNTAAVPEPSTYAMFGTAFAILGFVGYRKRKAA